MCGSTKFSSFDSMRPEAAEASTASVVGSQKAVLRPLPCAATAVLVSLPKRRTIVAWPASRIRAWSSCCCLWRRAWLLTTASASMEVLQWAVASLFGML